MVIQSDASSKNIYNESREFQAKYLRLVLAKEKNLFMVNLGCQKFTYYSDWNILEIRFGLRRLTCHIS